MSWLKWEVLDPNISDNIVYLPCGVTHSLKDRSYYSYIMKNARLPFMTNYLKFT